MFDKQFNPLKYCIRFSSLFTYSLQSLVSRHHRNHHSVFGVCSSVDQTSPSVSSFSPRLVPVSSTHPRTSCLSDQAYAISSPCSLSG